LTRHLLPSDLSSSLYRTLHLVPRTPSHASLQAPYPPLSRASNVGPPSARTRQTTRALHLWCTLRFPLPNQPRQSGSLSRTSTGPRNSPSSRLGSALSVKIAERDLQK